jgi:hypothetical protein
MFDDVSTFIDVVFPKFELEWGCTTYIFGDQVFS